MKNIHRRLLNWSLILQEYNLQIEHVKGKDKICVDPLLRFVSLQKNTDGVNVSLYLDKYAL